MNLATRVRKKSTPLISRVDEELVIFCPKNGMYYGTQAVGSRIWSLIENETTISAICDQLIQEYEVERSTCEEEVITFLKQLERENLINLR